jgi:putrescine transport system ATP-binding protein
MNANGNAMVELTHLSKTFGEELAVRDVNVTAGKGEFITLLGPSGCGKTTTLRCIAGLERFDAGEIRIGGDVVAAPERGIYLNPEQRNIGMVFQSYAVWPHMTVFDNVAYGLRVRRAPSGIIKERTMRSLELVGLGNLAERFATKLSGGQRQRVALARSLAKQPKVLLLDEPLGALDKKLREETQFELMDLQHELGLTFIVVTHDQEEAMTMADRIAVMDKGEVMQVATPAEIYEAPATRFVADFVGTVNLFEGKVAGREGQKGRLVGVDGSSLRIDNLAGAENDAAAWFAVRPEKIGISAAKPEDESLNMIDGEVWDIAYLGDMTIHHVRLDDGRIVRTSSINDRRAAAEQLTWHDRAWIWFRPDAGVVLTR